jgi:hypothetical protein
VQEVKRLVMLPEPEDEMSDLRDHAKLMLGCPPPADRAMSDTYPRQSEPLELNEADDGLVVYDPAQETVHHLNASAALIFDLCDGTRDAETIARLLAEAYSLDAPPRDEALAGLQDLADRKLISWDAHRAA